MLLLVWLQLQKVSAPPVSFAKCSCQMLFLVHSICLSRHAGLLHQMSSASAGPCSGNVLIPFCLLGLQAALLLNLWDSLKPKFDREALKRPKRPVQYNFDEEVNIDDIVSNIASVRKIGGKRF